ncbi:MAG: hypothetical protein U1F98_12570 [Verrucomicrobiota bacterium]
MTSTSTVNGVAALVLAAVMIAAGAGCVTKSKAREEAQAQARLAYIAGQQDAFMQMRRESNGPTVLFNGPVNAHLVKWTAGLGLARGIVEAGYNAPAAPRVIVVQRGNQRIEIDPSKLLGGEDVPLEPGDIVELRP